MNATRYRDIDLFLNFAQIGIHVFVTENDLNL